MSEDFSAPMPWIGRYIVAASLICILAMLADAVQGIRRRKFWLPCRFFTLNAASLTLLGVAVKLPLDLNNPMPGEVDQIAKLTSVVFMLTAMANFMPSLAQMDKKDIFMNMTALCILVVTLVTNVCIELGTGVIYYQKIVPIVVMLSIISLFVIMCFSALTVPTIKSHLELNYRERVQIIAIEDLVEGEKPVVVKLKENLRKFHIMADTGNPQFVMARSATCAACCTICCLNALLLLKVSLRENLYGAHVKSMSDYRRSTYCISRIQFGGVAIGTLSLLIRWFTIATMKSSNGSSIMIMTKVEMYWLERLTDWKESPSRLQIKNPKCRKLVQKIQNLILRNCIRVQILIVVVSKLVQFFSILLVRLLCFGFCSCRWCINVLKSNGSKQNAGSGSESGSESAEDMKLDLSCYVLHLEGEEELIPVMSNKMDDASWMMEFGRKHHPKCLVELLQNQIPSLNTQEPPNGWKMPVVTLATIATTIPNINSRMVDNLLLSVNQGLKYVSFIEDVLGSYGNSEKCKRAADLGWLDVYLFRRWLDQDLQKMALQGKTGKGILQDFADMAQSYITRFKDGNTEVYYPKWPAKFIAANSMREMSQILLQSIENIDEQTEEQIFKYISAMISDSLGACLINLPSAITKKCSASAIEKWEESVQQAVCLLAEAEELIEVLQQPELLNLHPEDDASISGNNLSPLPTSSNSDLDSSSPDELQIVTE